MSKLTLGDLAFKAEDFDECWYASKAVTYEDVAERANRILEEKLKRAQEVVSCRYHGSISVSHWVKAKLCLHCKSKARLVCIEELKPKE